MPRGPLEFLPKVVVIFSDNGYFGRVIRFPHVWLACVWLALVWPALVCPPLGAAEPAPEPQNVTVYYSDRAPYAMVNGQKGLLVNLAKAVLSEAGLKPRFIELPSNRIEDLVRTGQPGALALGWYRTPEAETWGRFSLPLYQERPVVALVNSRAGANLGNPVRLDTLLTSGLILGIRASTSLGAPLDRRLRVLGLVPLETVVDNASLIRMVQAGRMDYTLLAEEEAQYLLERDPSLTPGLTLTRLVDPPPGNFRYFLYPAGFDSRWAIRIDAAIDRVRNSSRYRDLISTTP